jgi:hypothetical protein
MWFLNEETHKLYFHSNKYEHRHQVGICHSRTWVHNVCRSYPHLSFHTLTSGFSWIMIEWIKWIRPHSPLILTIKWKETYYRWPMMLQWLQIQYSLMGGYAMWWCASNGNFYVLTLFLLLCYWAKTSWFMSSFFIVMLEQLFHIIDLLFCGSILGGFVNWWENCRFPTYKRGRCESLGSQSPSKGALWWTKFIPW